MKKLYDYIIESSNPVSDEAILYKIGKYKFNANQTIRSSGSNALQNAIKKYNIDKDNPRAGLIRWAKSVTPRLLPDNEEIIHRKYWSLDTLNGETEKQLIHLDYWTIGQYILQNHKRKHDILTVFECSTSKPYASNKIIKANYLEKYGAFTDFACMSNPGLIPLEYSQFYPYRFDEWDHGAESKDIANKYRIVNKYRFVNYIKKLGYKHVIVLMQNPYTQLCIDDAYDENIGDCKDWLHIVTDKQFWKTSKSKYLQKFDNNMGLLIQRLLTQPYTRESYRRNLKKCLNGDDVKKFEKLVDLIKNEKPDKIKEYNKELGWEPIDYLHGISGVKFKRLTQDTAVTKSKVDDYKSFIEKELEDIKSFDEKPEKYYENSIYNTALDWLLKYFDGKPIKDPDTEYWNMRAALDDVNSLGNFGDYCYYIKDVCDKHNIKIKHLEEEADKLKLIQLKLKQKKAKVDIK